MLLVWEKVLQIFPYLPLFTGLLMKHLTKCYGNEEQELNIAYYVLVGSINLMSAATLPHMK